MKRGSWFGSNLAGLVRGVGRGAEAEQQPLKKRPWDPLQGLQDCRSQEGGARREGIRISPAPAAQPLELCFSTFFSPRAQSSQDGSPSAPRPDPELEAGRMAPSTLAPGKESNTKTQPSCLPGSDGSQH